MLQEHLRVPFETSLLGVPVRVTAVDLNDADEIVAGLPPRHRATADPSDGPAIANAAASWAGNGSKPTGTGHGASAKLRRPPSDAYVSSKQKSGGRLVAAPASAPLERVTSATYFLFAFRI